MKHQTSNSLKFLFAIRYMLFAVLVAFFAFVALIVASVPCYAFKPNKQHKRDAKRFSVVADSMRKIRRRPAKSAKTAFSKFNKKHSGRWRVRYNPRSAFPEAMVGGKTQKYSGSPKAAAGKFLRDNESLLGVRAADLRLVLSKTARGITHMIFEQTWNGIPVENATVKVHINSGGEVISYQSRFEPDISVSQTPSIPESSARAAASSDLGKPITKKGKLVFFPFEKDGTVHLAWKIKSSMGGITPGRWIYYVDAHSGDILFRYNTLKFAVSGSVHGMVYPVSPSESVVSPMPIANQYVWIGSYANRVETVETGTYSTTQNGKIFASLKGPYFSVSNFGGASAHYDNGKGQWSTQYTPVQSQNPYSNNMDHTQTVTIPDRETTGIGTCTITFTDTCAFAKVMPHFKEFEVGNWNWNDDKYAQYYDLTDNDELHIVNAQTGKRAGSHLGSRTSSFYGAAVENPSYILNLKTNESGVYSGYKVDKSSYLVLTDSPAVTSSTSSSFMWTDTHTYVSYGEPLDEINAFYHLNKMHDYFTGGVNKSGDVDLSWTLPVMVHALGEPDKFPLHHGYCNAFYDKDQDNIMLGDGYDGGSYALDGTVIRHEYSHAVVHRIFPLIYWGESGAIDEAMADYWSLSSFSCATLEYPGCVLNELGSFLGGRSISSDCEATSPSYCHVMPDNWKGEVHDDSLMLSEALWELRSPEPIVVTNDNYLGISAADGYAGLPRADVFVFNSLFYFPDNFANFLDAMIVACAQIDGGGVACPMATKNKIYAAFGNHGISSSFDAPPPGGYDVYENNNGPEVAADISAINPVTAYIYPEADIDYYSIPLAPGTFRATIHFPEASWSDTYHAFVMDLFDAERRYLATAMPRLYNPTFDGYCPPSGECTTLESSSVLQYEIAAPGRYYIAVSPGPWEWGYSKDYSELPYSIHLDFNPSGSAKIEKFEATFDNDVFKFSVPCTKFNFGEYEVEFEYAQLRDHSFTPLQATRTDDPNSYLEIVDAVVYGKDIFGQHIISGRMHLKPGFNARYPAVGTVHLEIFAKTRMSGVAPANTVVSLGISNPLNLTTNKTEATMWNNIIAPGKGTSATVRYDLMSAGHLSIKLYTLDGSLVKTLFDGNVTAGKGSVDWTGKNDLGSNVASGIYLVKIKGPGVSKIRKIVVVK